MTNGIAIINYFGRQTVEQALTAYLKKHGISWKTERALQEMQRDRPDEFLEMICNFVERESV
jgi:hypothetical protein